MAIQNCHIRQPNLINKAKYKNMNKKELLKVLRGELKGLKAESRYLAKNGKKDDSNFIEGLTRGLEIAIHQVKRLK